MSQIHAYEDDAGSFIEEWGLEALRHVGFDDRRSNAGAYEAWTEMLRGRTCPSIEDLEPIGVAGARDVLIDLRCDGNDPELTCIGGALLADCGARGLKRLSQVPDGSFLALLGAHYRYAALVRHPIAFEGERVGADRLPAAYRAILLPFSSDGHEVDFVLGRISWREPAAQDLCEEIHRELEGARSGAVGLCPAHLWPQEPSLELPPAG